MTKEKKIEIIKRNIETIKNHLKIPIVDECVDLKEQLKYELSIYERELKILQIEPRTIETLKVGDCLDITINDENVTCYLKIDNIETAKEYLNSLKSYEIHQIIPREFLELWGEINA